MCTYLKYPGSINEVMYVCVSRFEGLTSATQEEFSSQVEANRHQCVKFNFKSGGRGSGREERQPVEQSTGSGGTRRRDEKRGNAVSEQ